MRAHASQRAIRQGALAAHIKPMEAGYHIYPARAASDIADVARLFREYEASIGVDLGAQGFADELATLPGSYAPPHGVLLLAAEGNWQPFGCVAVRPLGAGRCEMKRLYVADAGRGRGLGRVLVEAIIAEARRLGHSEMLLDTLPSMGTAVALYRRLGFEPADPYNDSPLGRTLYFGRSLA